MRENFGGGGKRESLLFSTTDSWSGMKKERARLFSEVYSGRMRCNGCKLQERKFQLSIRRNFPLSQQSSTGTESQGGREISIFGDTQISADQVSELALL